MYKKTIKFDSWADYRRIRSICQFWGIDHIRGLDTVTLIGSYQDVQHVLNSL